MASEIVWMVVGISPLLIGAAWGAYDLIRWISRYIARRREIRHLEGCWELPEIYADRTTEGGPK